VAPVKIQAKRIWLNVLGAHIVTDFIVISFKAPCIEQIKPFL
jgi:hypothetical protein